MAKALEPAVAPDDIFFELERFERSEGRLNLTGRWFGVRGRRFVRPTLTLDTETGRIRALAALEGKPWAAEDGEPWTASFPWEDKRRVEESELAVAPDIAIQLPPLNPRRARMQRLTAVPRRETMTASWGDFAAPLAIATEAPVREPEAPVTKPREPELLEPDAHEPERHDPEAREPAPAPELSELEAVRAQVTEARGALASSAAELDTTRAQLDSLRAELRELTGEREAALRSAAQAEADRDAALTQAAHAEGERDAIAAEKAEFGTALERAQAEIKQLQAGYEQLRREHDQALASRGAAMVMRGATQTLPAYEPHVGWVRRWLVVLVLIAIVFAGLIVLNVL